MNKILIVFSFFLLVSDNAISQDKKSKKTKPHHIIKKNVKPDYDTLYCGRVETDAKFGEDSTAWNKYLQQHINTGIPKMNGAPIGRYEIMIQFVVDKYGVIIEPPIPLTHSGYGMEEEVIRIIKTSPKWIPATQNGRVVSYRRRQSFTFTVSEPLITGTIHFTFNERLKSNS